MLCGINDVGVRQIPIACDTHGKRHSNRTVNFMFSILDEAHVFRFGLHCFWISIIDIIWTQECRNVETVASVCEIPLTVMYSVELTLVASVVRYCILCQCARLIPIQPGHEIGANPRRKCECYPNFPTSSCWSSNSYSCSWRMTDFSRI